MSKFPQSLFEDEEITITHESPKTPAKSRAEKFEDYNGFINKFKPKKTTDDCYTPQPVYDAVRDWVDTHIMPLEGVSLIRPFWPGADYENTEYPEGCLVLDNPPFSQLAKIRRFYHARNIKYFLFAPLLTLLNSAKELFPESCFILIRDSITYENGAQIATAFVTNLDCGGVGLWCSGDLNHAVREASKSYASKKSVPPPVYEYPLFVGSAALLQKIAVRGVEFTILHEDMALIGSIASQKAQGKAIFGGGFLLSERAAAERAAAERAAAERAAAKTFQYWELSDEEKRIIKSLGTSQK